MEVFSTIIFVAAIAGLALIAFLTAEGRRYRDPDRQRRLHVRARTSALRAESRAHAGEPAEDEALAERQAIETRLEQERRRNALVDAE
jgi:hypothetical protein